LLLWIAMRAMALLLLACCLGHAPTLAAQMPSKPGQEAELRLAFAQARSGSLTDASRLLLKNHALRPWLDALQFKHGLATANSAQVLALIQNNPDLPSSTWLIGQWRQELIRRNDWPGLSQWQTRYPDNALGTRCGLLLAVPAERRDAAWRQSALQLWLDEVQQPAHCKAVNLALSESGFIDDALAWQRFDRALAEPAIEALPESIARLSPTQAMLASSYQAALNGGNADFSEWPGNARSRQVIALSLQALAKQSPTEAENKLIALPQSLTLSNAQRDGVLIEIALWSLVNYLPEAERRFYAVPESARSANLREWFMRWQFANNDDRKTLDAFSQLLPNQLQETRWLYFRARVLQRLNQEAQAKVLYQQAAQAATFHGWLAADRLQSPYALCPVQPMPNAADKTVLSQHAGLTRALWLWQLNEANTAIWEWNAAFKTLNAEQQRQAVAMAQQIGWYDRAVFSLEAGEQNTRLYGLRFATPYLNSFRAAAARFGLDLSWLMAHARAESIFMPDVVSSANARGLLQVLPSTAEAIALRHDIPWQGADSLYRPEVNIPLGAGALQEVVARYPGKAYQAIAAYNAGPTATQRWIAARDALEPEFWIETVPYKETREYVPRVLAFSVLYDWRLQQPVRRLGDRLLGDFSQNQTARLQCPAPPAPADKTEAKPTKRKGRTR
jgi:soluble lytic murein transglycosylase